MPFLFRGLFGRDNNNGGDHGSHRRTNPASHYHSVDGTSARTRAHDAVAGAGSAESGASALPSAGIRAGEIIGHRLWWIVQQDGVLWLRSLAHPLLWVPGEPVHGDVRTVVARSVVVVRNRDGSSSWGRKELLGGVYSYTTSAGFSREILYWSQFADIGTGLVCGTVKLWGEVVEHKEGYRAEFAKVHSLRAVVWGAANLADLEALRRRYLPEG